MNKAKGLLYYIDKQGHLQFSTSGILASDAESRESGWEHPAVSIVIMLICGVLDFVMFKQLFGSFLYDSVIIQMLSIIAMLIGFDLAPVYLGIVLKKRKQGINSSLMVAFMMIAAFLIAFIGNVVLRISVRDLVLPDYSNAITSTIGGVAQSDTRSNLSYLYALFASSMPVITSLVSFGVSFQSSNPLMERVSRLKKQQVDLEESIAEIEAILQEYRADPDYYQRLLEQDQLQYESLVNLIHEKSVLYCHYTRERIKEHLGEPASNNELSKDNRSELLRLFDDVDRRYGELLDTRGAKAS